MKVFVIGSSDVGKTTIARRIADTLHVQLVSASAWVREAMQVTDASHANKEDRARALTKYSVSALRRDPRVSFTHLASRNDLTQSCVIDGIRNPYDFVHLFDPRHDLVLFMVRAGVGAGTIFEGGVQVIRAYLDHLFAADLVAAENRHCVMECLHSDFGEEVETAIGLVVQRAERHMRATRLACGAGLPLVYGNVQEFSVQVKKEYFYDMDPRYVGELEACVVFAMSGYPGDVPTFSVRTEDGAVFSYVPPSTLVRPGFVAIAGDSELSLRDLVYHNCPKGPLIAIVLTGLLGAVQVYLKHRGEWVSGEYVLTVDWYEGNELLHLIALNNGQYALQPSHKVMFGTSRTFPDFRKMHSVWRV